jgi:hypothetical protein
MNKAFIDYIVEEKVIQQEAILHKLSVMNQKFDALYKEVFNIEIMINNQVDSLGHFMETNDHFPTSKGTPTNPIELEKD